MSAQGQINETVRQLVAEGVAAARQEAADAVAALEMRLAVLEEHLRPKTLTVSASVTEDDPLPEPLPDDDTERTAPARRSRVRKPAEG